MAKTKNRCRLNVYWLSGLTLILISLIITAKVILRGKSKVGYDGE